MACIPIRTAPRVTCLYEGGSSPLLFATAVSSFLAFLMSAHSYSSNSMVSFTHQLVRVGLTQVNDPGLSSLPVSEEISDQKESDVLEEKDLTLDNIDTADSIVQLGRTAASMLMSFGTATFVLDEQGGVRLASPYQVYINEEVAHPPEGVEPVYVRPIITNRKPQYVAKMSDGSLWEVEFPNPKLDEPDESVEKDELNLKELQ